MSNADMDKLSVPARIWEGLPHAIELVCGRCETHIATGSIGLTPNWEPFVAWEEPSGTETRAAVWVAGDSTRLGNHGYMVITCPACSLSHRVNAHEQLCASLLVLGDPRSVTELRRGRLALGINVPRLDEETIAFIDNLPDAPA